MRKSVLGARGRRRWPDTGADRETTGLPAGLGQPQLRTPSQLTRPRFVATEAGGIVGTQAPAI
jgi:hypothetical protein